jgi:hypothetical protein
MLDDMARKKVHPAILRLLEKARAAKKSKARLLKKNARQKSV